MKLVFGRCVSSRATWIAVVSLLCSGTARSQTLLIADKDADALLVFDTASGRVVRTVSVGGNPHEVVATADGRLAFTANARSNTVSVVDLLEGKEIKRLASPLFAYPHGMAIHPDGKTLYLTSEQKRLLLLIDIARLEVTGQVSTEKDGSHMVVLSPRGEWAYVSDRGSAAVTVIDTRKLAVAKHLPAGDGVEGIALSSDGRWLLVGNRRANDIQLFDAPGHRSLARIPVAEDPVRVAISPDGTRALVPHRRSSEVHLVDLRRREILARVRTGKEPGGVLFLPDGKRAIVANTGEGTLSVLELEPLTVRSTHPAGKGPDGLYLLRVEIPSGSASRR
jgi:DNA-binding beta-propeller fold protein YncE